MDARQHMTDRIGATRAGIDGAAQGGRGRGGEAKAMGLKAGRLYWATREVPSLASMACSTAWSALSSLAA